MTQLHAHMSRGARGVSTLSHAPTVQMDVARSLEMARLQPALLSGHELLMLQRTIGNHAVGSLLSPDHGSPTSIQRLISLKSYDDRVKAHTDQKAELDQIRQTLSDFHDIKPKSDPQYQQRLATLNRLERSISAWFSKHVTGAIAEVPNGGALQSMLDETEKEHRKLVAGTTKNPNLLPIDTKGLGEDERKELLALWRSIVNGTGNLKIKAGITQGNFKDRMLSGLARLLETPAGRDLLKEVNATRPKGQEVVLGANFKSELKKFGRTDPGASQAVPKTAEGDVSSMAFSVDTNPPDDEEIVDYTGKQDATEFNQFVTHLPKGTTHFRFDGTVYKLGTGVGSYVKMAGKGGVEANIGARGQEVVNPEFITLGHELGHSVRMLQGTTVPFIFDTKRLGFTGNEDERKLWNNAEEYVNINAIEGSLRQQHGLEPRLYHAGNWLKTQGPIMRSKMDKLLTNKVAAEKFPKEHAELLEVYKNVLTQPSDDKRLLILTSPETRKLIQDLEQAVGVEPSAPKTDEPVSDKPEVSVSDKPEVSVPDKPDVGSKLPLVSSDGDGVKKALVESSGGSEVGELDGTPYEILNARVAVHAESPIEQLGGERGGSSSKKSGGKSGESAYGYLSRHNYESARGDFANWLKRHGIRAIPNGGGGRNNCLIISLVQLARGTEDEPSMPEMGKFKAELSQYGIGESQALLPTDQAFEALVNAINKKYSTSIRPVYAIAFGNQEPPYALISSGVGSTPVVVWDKMGHYEALVRG